MIQKGQHVEPGRGRWVEPPGPSVTRRRPRHSQLGEQRGKIGDVGEGVAQPLVAVTADVPAVRSTVPEGAHDAGHVEALWGDLRAWESKMHRVIPTR
jgi:hypothetical protein